MKNLNQKMSRSSFNWERLNSMDRLTRKLLKRKLYLTAIQHEWAIGSISTACFFALFEHSWKDWAVSNIESTLSTLSKIKVSQVEGKLF